MKTTLANIAKQNARLIVGMASLWAYLHVSPYFPFSLSPHFSSSSFSDIPLRHALYAFALMAFFLLAIATRDRMQASNRVVWALALSAGIAGTAGQGVIMADLPALAASTVGASPSVVEGVAIILCAYAVATFTLLLLSQASELSSHIAACAIALSYCLFSLIWLCITLLAPEICMPATMLCPAVSAAAAIGACRKPSTTGKRPATAPNPDSELESPTSTFSRERYVELRKMLAFCLVFVFFAAICVRLFTAMEQGTLSAGSLSGMQYAITAAGGLLASAGICAYLLKHSNSPSALFTVFAILALFFMGTLLLVATCGDGMGALMGKRLMVSGEHLFALLAAIIIVTSGSPTPSHITRSLALYGITVIALPQFVSIDVLSITGALTYATGTNLIIPIACISAFLAATIIVLLLLRNTERTNREAAMTNEDWQRNLVMKACEGKGLTQREKDVAVLTYRGLSAKRISEELFVSESTVKTHQSHIYRKLDIHRKQDFIAYVDALRS